MTVLYDGERKQYLLQNKYAIAISPRLQLFTPKLSEQRLQVFVGGVGEQQLIDGIEFPKIENLREELEGIGNKMAISKPLLNADFTQLNLQQQLKSGNFSAVHLKTHGEFSSDPEGTFIVAYQKLIKARDLAELISSDSKGESGNIELLVLSACKTAQGDNRAVLGLAGLAVRAGARSTLSTLWEAQDIPNTQLMLRFYEELSKPGMTKARALHIAQQDLFESYPAPYFWATYVLVGNWL
jgi:CHAT domain-containing protein